VTVGGNEIVVDGRGNICINGAGFDFYINGAGFDFAGGEAPKPGYVKLITPDGLLRHLRVIRRPAHRVRYRRRGRPTGEPSPTVSARSGRVRHLPATQPGID